MDTRTKRASALTSLRPYVIAPPAPDGTIDQGDRQHLGFAYGGTFAGSTLGRSKRASALTALRPYVIAPPYPDTTISQGDRQHIAYMYSGILAGGLVFPDAVIFAETLVRQAQKTISEAVSLVEILDAVRIVVRDLSDTVDLSESLDITVDKQLGDTLLMFESLERVVAKAISETPELLEDLKKQIDRLFSEQLSLTEELQVTQVELAETSDELALTEELATELIEDVAGPSHYEIRLLFGRQVIVSEIEYEYRWESNAHDFGAEGARHLVIEVQGRTSEGQLGDIARIEVQNPEPNMAAVTPVIISFADAVLIEWGHYVPEDFDFDHYDVVVGFSPTTLNRIYRRGREQNNVIIPCTQPIWFQIVPYDAFGAGIPTDVFLGVPNDTLNTVLT